MWDKIWAPGRPKSVLTPAKLEQPKVNECVPPHQVKCTMANFHSIQIPEGSGSGIFRQSVPRVPNTFFCLLEPQVLMIVPLVRIQKAWGKRRGLVREQLRFYRLPRQHWGGLETLREWAGQASGIARGIQGALGPY